MSHVSHKLVKYENGVWTQYEFRVPTSNGNGKRWIWLHKLTRISRGFSINGQARSPYAGKDKHISLSDARKCYKALLAKGFKPYTKPTQPSFSVPGYC